MGLCKVCLSSEILCNGCTHKLESGEATKVEVDVARAIRKFSRKLSDAGFLEAVEASGRIYIVVESKNAAKFIGSGGRNIRKLSEALGKPVKMLEKTMGDERQVIEKLIGVQIIGINKVYPEESYKIRLEKKFMKSVKPLSVVVGKILGKKISFVFE